MGHQFMDAATLAALIALGLPACSDPAADNDPNPCDQFQALYAQGITDYRETDPDCCTCECWNQGRLSKESSEPVCVCSSELALEPVESCTGIVRDLAESYLEDGTSYQEGNDNADLICAWE